MSTDLNNAQIVKLEEQNEKDSRRYDKLQGYHGKTLKKLNVYSDEMATLSAKIRRNTYKLSIAKRNRTKGDDKRG